MDLRNPLQSPAPCVADTPVWGSLAHQLVQSVLLKLTNTMNRRRQQEKGCQCASVPGHSAGKGSKAGVGRGRSGLVADPVVSAGKSFLSGALYLRWATPGPATPSFATSPVARFTSRRSQRLALPVALTIESKVSTVLGRRWVGGLRPPGQTRNVGGSVRLVIPEL